MCREKVELGSLLPPQYVSHGHSSFTAAKPKLQHPGKLEGFVSIFVVIWVTLVSRKKKKPKTLGVDQGMSGAYMKGSCEVP